MTPRIFLAVGIAAGFLAQCKERTESSAASSGGARAVATTPTEAYACTGERPASASLDGSKESRLILRRVGARLFVRDASMPWRGDFPFQMSLSVPQPAVSYGDEAFKKTPLKDGKGLVTYKADCNRFEKDNAKVPAWNKNCHAWEGDMALLADANLFQQANVTVHFGRAWTNPFGTRQNGANPGQVGSFEFLIPYRCEAYKDETDPVRRDLETLREYFSLRNAVNRPYYRADWLGPFGPHAVPDPSDLPAGGDMASAKGLLQESLYRLKATRTLAGLPPRANFLATTTHRDYHEERGDLKSFKVSRKQYGFLAKDVALTAFDAVLKDFEATYAGTFDPIYAGLPAKRVAFRDAAAAFANLAKNETRFAVGAFNYRDSDCNKYAPVVVLVDKAEKVVYPFIVPVCAP